MNATLQQQFSKEPQSVEEKKSNKRLILAFDAIRMTCAFLKNCTFYRSLKVCGKTFFVVYYMVLLLSSFSTRYVQRLCNMPEAIFF